MDMAKSKFKKFSKILTMEVLTVILVIAVIALTIHLYPEEEIKQVAEDKEQDVVCDLPYIRFEDGCCLDQNENSICDDETVEEETGSVMTGDQLRAIVGAVLSQDSEEEEEEEGDNDDDEADNDDDDETPEINETEETPEINETEDETSAENETEMPLEGDIVEVPELLEDSDFPITETVLNEDSINFVYGRVEHAFTVSYITSAKFISAISFEGEDGFTYQYIPISHDYGETGGALVLGNVNYYDTDSDDDPNLYMKAIELVADVEATIIVDTEPLEICSNSIDDNDNGRIDCQDSSCEGASGGDGVCESHEYSCEDDFDNDGDGLTDLEDGNCYGPPCGDPEDDTYGIWSYVPQEDTSVAPARTGCCQATQCINIGGDCIDYEVPYTTAGGNTEFKCGDQNDWDRCGPDTSESYNKHPEDISDGGTYVCVELEEDPGEYTWQPRVV